MLCVYFGNDRRRVRAEAGNFVAKNFPPPTATTPIDPTSYQSGQLADALGATSLFGGVEVYLIDNPTTSVDLQTDITDKVLEMSESPNVFIILADSLSANLKKIYTKHATNLEEFTLTKPEPFNPFLLADALLDRNRRRLWVLLQEAVANGRTAEEIVNILWWQLKILRLAEITTNATTAGVKDYPYNKAKRALTKFKTGEVSRLTHSLLVLYHEGHAGERDMAIALEEWVLRG